MMFLDMRYDKKCVELYVIDRLSQKDTASLIQDLSRDPHDGQYKRDDFESLLCYARQKLIPHIEGDEYPIGISCSYEEMNDWLDSCDEAAADRKLGSKSP